MDHGERGAGQRPHVAHRQVYLVGSGGVKFQVPEAPTPRRGEARGLLAGRDGLLQSGHPCVDLPGFHVRALSPPGVSVLEGISHLFEHGCRLVEERVGGVFDHTLGVDGDQRVDKQGGATADQRLQEAIDRESGMPRSGK